MAGSERQLFRSRDLGRRVLPMVGDGGAAVACRDDRYTLAVLDVAGATTPPGGAGRPFG